MTKQIYAKIRSVMGTLAMLSVLAMLFFQTAITSSAWALLITALIALVCDIHGVMANAGIVADENMYPEREKHLGLGASMTFLPTLVGMFMFAHLVFGTLESLPAALLVGGNFLLVLALGYLLGGLLNRKYRAAGEAWYKAEAMADLDAVMDTLGMDPADQQAVRDSMADKAASDIYATADALEDLHNICPAALGAKTQQPSQP